MRIQLFPATGGRPIELERDLTVVGRVDECDLKLDHKSVSKLHCVLLRNQDQLVIRDLGSTNGTRVNGQRVRRATVFNEDQLSIAACVFRVVLVFADEPAAMPIPTNCTIRMDAPKGPKSPILAAPMPIGSESDSVVMESAGPKSNSLPDHYPD